MMNNNREITEEQSEIDENIENTEVYEGEKGYALKSTFDQNKFHKIQGLELSLRTPNNTTFAKLKNIFKRKKLIIHEYHEIEKSISVENMSGQLKLNLITKQIINDALRKIKNEEKRSKIQYVYLAGIQILVKSLFKEGIDSPIVLSLHDQRFNNPNISHLGTIEGNLCYKKLLFTCYPRYCISIQDKNFDDALSLNFKLLKDLSLKKGNKVLTFYYSALYTMSNSNYGNIYENKPYIEINEECRDISEAIEPLIQEPSIPENYQLSIEDKPNLGERRIEQPLLQFHNKELIRIEPGRNSFRKNNYASTSKNEKVIKNTKSQGTMVIQGEYFNGIDYINGSNLLIDTGASSNHMAINKNKGLIIKEVEAYKYQNFDGKIYISDKQVNVPITIKNTRIIVPCYIDNTMTGESYHILLGNNFLNQLDYYKIEKEGVTMIINNEEIFCRKEKM